jgi:hypothetical protein
MIAVGVLFVLMAAWVFGIVAGLHRLRERKGSAMTWMDYVFVGLVTVLLITSAFSVIAASLRR